MKDKRLKLEYAEALLVYATTTERLKSITDRLGLRYNTVVNYMRNNFPIIMTQHKALLLEMDRERFAEGVTLLQISNLSPHQVMVQLGYTKKSSNTSGQITPNSKGRTRAGTSPGTALQRWPNMPKRWLC